MKCSRAFHRMAKRIAFTAQYDGNTEVFQCRLSVETQENSYTATFSVMICQTGWARIIS
ncbi:MAG: hypothetical protein U5L72_19520 [Bacteroidales bacterium]|nr:hypothetical protein [Bacteroidales bacterium]